jgi:hypothetical protein
VLGDAQRTTNHEQLFVHEGRLLRGLHCDVLYTIPIELAYSHAQNELVNSFGGRILSLPVIALSDRDGTAQPARCWCAPLHLRPSDERSCGRRRRLRR